MAARFILAAMANGSLNGASKALNPMFRQALVQPGRRLLGGNHVIDLAREHDVMQCDTNVVGNNALGIRISPGHPARQNVRHLNELVLELGVVAKRSNVTLIIADNLVKREVTLLETSCVHGNKKTARSKIIW